MGGKRLTEEDKYHRSRSERDWQNFVIARALNHGWTYYHAPDNKPCNGRRQKIVPGFPDLVLVKGSKLVFAELKAETGRVSAEQKVWLAKLAATGCEAHIWRPSQWKEVNEYLENN